MKVYSIKLVVFLIAGLAGGATAIPVFAETLDISPQLKQEVGLNSLSKTENKESVKEEVASTSLPLENKESVKEEVASTSLPLENTKPETTHSSTPETPSISDTTDLPQSKAAPSQPLKTAITTSDVVAAPQQASDLRQPFESQSLSPTRLFIASESLKIAQDTVPVATSVTPFFRAPNGFYFGISGATQSRERSAEETTAIDFTQGYALNGAIGYRLDDLRVEGEVSYFNNSNKAFVFPGGSENASGQVALRAFMLNLYYDVPLYRSRLKPYIGGGLGTYKSDIQGFTSPTLINAEIFPPNGVVLNVTSRETFAYQLRAGLNYLLGSDTELYAGYRYFHGSRLEFQTGNPFGILRPTGAITHNLEFGFRHSF